MGNDNPEVRGMSRFRRRRSLWQPLRLWAQALRVHFLSASLIPVLLGTVVAQSATTINGWRFLLVLVGVFCYHGGANLINDYYDEETDRLNRQPSFFNGGSGVLVKRLLPAKQVKKAAVLCFLVGTVCAAVLALTGGGVGVALFALAGLGCGYFYSAPPFRLAATGFGELCVGLAFGPFLVVGTVAALTGRFLPAALLVSLPVGILIAAVILTNELPDCESDRQTGKHTLVVRLGRERSILLLSLLLALASCLLLLIFVGLGASRYRAGSLLAWPLVFWLWSQRRAGLKQLSRFVMTSAGVILLHMVSGLMLIITFMRRGS
ncbi:MAG TPA: prenyltransferase [Firmicutes bacterium]|nr:prenyltransferase [Bacillota bacterium]